jgi:S1-C subfamily serine protease
MFDRRKSRPIKRPASLCFTIIILGLSAVNLAAQPDRAPKSFADLAKRVEPAVVSIDTKSKMAQPVAKGTPAAPAAAICRRQRIYH